MFPKRLLTYSKNALLIVFAMIVVAGATGLSYKAHFCHDKLSGIAFYTEIGLQHSATCGCEGDKGVGHHSATNGTFLNKNSCCSNISYFKKLTLVSSANDFSVSTCMQTAVINLFSDNFLPEQSGNDILSSFDFRFRPPPLTGRELVLFLSQLRIPLIVYNS
jgi:hypothetical protein